MADENTQVPAEQTPGATASTPVDTGASATPSAADAGADTPATNEGEGEQPKPKKRGGGFQDRIKELTDKVRERDQRIAELSAKAGGEANDGAAPKRENFASYEDFVEARATYAAEQAFARKERERAEQSAADARDERVDAFVAGMTSAAAEDPAFQKAWQTVTAKGYPVSEAMFDFVSESDDPHALVEWLAGNRAEAAKLYHASPSLVSRTLARVEAKLVSSPPARTPQAPPPPPTVGGRSTPRVDMSKLASSKDASSYIEKRRAEQARAS